MDIEDYAMFPESNFELKRNQSTFNLFILVERKIYLCLSKYGGFIPKATLVKWSPRKQWFYVYIDNFASWWKLNFKLTKA